MRLEGTQDWEYSQEVTRGVWETIDLQIPTQEEAIKQAQDWANKTRQPCYVTTSIRYESELGVEDRINAPNNPAPIRIDPQ